MCNSISARISQKTKCLSHVTKIIMSVTHKTILNQAKTIQISAPLSLSNIFKNSPKISPKKAIPQIAPQKLTDFPVLG